MIRSIRSGLFCLFLMAIAMQASATHLQFVPGNATGVVGEQRSLAIQIVDVDPLLGVGAFDFTVSYDPSVLALSQAVGGTSLGPVSTGLLSFAAPGSVELLEVSFELPEVLLAQQAGSFTLATLTFDLIGVGSSALDLLNVLLSDVNGNALAMQAAQPATVTVTPRSTPVTEPPALGHIAAGLAALVILGRLGRRA